MTKTIAPKFKISIFNLSLIFLFVSISIFQFNNQTLTSNTTPKSPQSEEQQRVVARRNYIVRFIEYKKAELHKEYLEENTKEKFKDSSSWEWINRNNPASKFPTDFGVVAMDDEAANSIIGEFGRLKMVKDVRVDSSYHLRNLLDSNNKKRDDLVGASSDVKKRPGKIFTSMSFGEGESNVAGEAESNVAATAAISNQTIDWGRHLLSQDVLD